jgi:deoxyribodipyrimidine photo-lyase
MRAAAGAASGGAGVIQDTRIRALNARPTRRGRYVLYWMQASCRASGNHALTYAIREANRLGQPVLACFGLTARFPEANARHYAFLLDGLEDASRALEGRGIRLVVRLGEPDQVAAELAGRASLVVTDRGYLRIQRLWRRRAAEALAVPLVQVESDVIVPVEAASSRDEFAAATLRPRLERRLAEYLVPLAETRPRRDSLGLTMRSEPLADLPALLRALGVDGQVPPVEGCRGGASPARARLRAFLERGLARYAAERNDPSRSGQSGLGPYLHFGHISPLEVALAMRRRRGPGRAAFLEELIVRRELSANFVLHNPDYDRWEGLPEWSRRSLTSHARDPRPHRYSAAELESARTHDPYWNAAQTELARDGTMHGYMRMYWGKKILEWSERPEDAFALALALNNRYQLDGRDPNSFAGVAWVFGKHDRPWPERPIFGKVRSMTSGGLERKFDVEAYVRRVRAG